MSLRQGAVKQARSEAGLSLAQVGKGQVTPPAIYLIETGRTRPSLPTLEHIARRTGKPVEYFLADPGGATDETQAGLVELEALVAASRFTEAVELGQRLLNLGSSAHRLGKIRFFLAHARMNLGQFADAGVLLQAAQAHFEAVDDQLMLAECLGSQASLLYATQKPGAQALVERALAICRSFKPEPAITVARLLAIQAAVLLTQNHWDQAIKSYQDAIEAAGSLYDLRQLALMYSGLALAYHEKGQVEAAARYGMRSIALFEVQRDRVSLARAENNLGLIYLAKKDKLAAKRHLDRSLELCDETDLKTGRGQVLLSLCELSLEEGNLKQADDFAAQALELAEMLGERTTVAAAHTWLGRIADRNGDYAATDRAFVLAISELTKLDLEERLLRCHGQYAEILERRGEMDKAYVHMKKAFAASRPGLLHHDEESVESASLA